MSDNDSSNIELYSPVKKINFELTIPDLSKDIQKPNGPSIPITLSKPIENDKDTEMTDRETESELAAKEIDNFDHFKFTAKPWNCVDTETLNIEEPTEVQINFDRAVYRVIERLK
eukprot:NODE_95_length_21511_cov_0.501168.p20 type:complete len:115 gc:universal NODE_95_length_21511_cov_0.501168:20759-21103(+)